MIGIHNPGVGAQGVVYTVEEEIPVVDGRIPGKALIDILGKTVAQPGHGLAVPVVGPAALWRMLEPKRYVVCFWSAATQGVGDQAPMSQRLFAAKPASWFGSGSGSPARIHHHLYIAYQIPPTITCKAIFPGFKSVTIYRPENQLAGGIVASAIRITATIMATSSKAPRRIVFRPFLASTGFETMEL